MPGGRLITRTNTDTPDRRATKVDQHSPAPAIDEVDDVCDWAYDIALAIADHLGHKHGPFRYRVDGVPVKWALTQHITYLTNHVDTVLGVDWHETTYDDAHRYARRLQRRTGTDDLIHRIRERCPSCDQRTLTREDGAGKVLCNNRDCQRIWTEDEYARLAVVVAS
ncbi:hypothetical protein [Luteipulveratus halotolerans]|uniref:Uncharacterized protein n=1 Tax=Luteipulveratus halotolerans TaxID=1631356 RepID=A0A0L6CJX6_9MICO|nr:hypothetical protein [Luteipulveratus halotolerans]KNX38087.1 hypothetical protein VV01_14555 [Luteipulveratus halotolerans]